MSIDRPAGAIVTDNNKLDENDPAAIIARRKASISEHRSDLERWANPGNLAAEWERRSEMAANYVPAGAVLVDLGCGAMSIERYLPMACTYRPVDIVARDPRTTVCDFNNGDFPVESMQGADMVVALGLLEYVYNLPGLLLRLATHRLPLLVSYCAADKAPGIDRRALGWVNDLTIEQFLNLAMECGLHPESVEHIDDLQILVKLSPDRRVVPAQKKVIVVSAAQTPNFGDKLGFHVLNQLLPPGAIVKHGFVLNLDSVKDEECDLLVIGIGNSMYRQCLSEELDQLMRRSKRSIGIFGTQYREDIDPVQMRNFLDRLDVWFARYKEDLSLYGRGRPNVAHLGDWLISQFPLATPWIDEPVVIEDVMTEEPDLARVILSIQQYKSVVSGHLHPLLCALTSAEQVAFREQHDMTYRPEVASGKFRSMLLDVFGRHFPEDVFFPVNRDFVARYKELVDRNMLIVKNTLAALLAN